MSEYFRQTLRMTFGVFAGTLIVPGVTITLMIYLQTKDQVSLSAVNKVALLNILAVIYF